MTRKRTRIKKDQRAWAYYPERLQAILEKARARGRKV